jgi:hypothetical protein
MRGKEILAKLPLVAYNYIKAKQREQWNASVMKGKKLQDSLAEAAGNELGDEAGQRISDGAIKVESFKRTTTTLGGRVGRGNRRVRRWRFRCGGVRGAGSQKPSTASPGPRRIGVDRARGCSNGSTNPTNRSKNLTRQRCIRTLRLVRLRAPSRVREDGRVALTVLRVRAGASAVDLMSGRVQQR